MSEEYEQLEIGELVHYVVAIIAEVTNTDPSEMWEGSLLMEDLNMTEDSLRVVARRLNQEFEIHLNVADLLEEFEAMTVIELTRYVHEEIAFG